MVLMFRKNFFVYIKKYFTFSETSFFMFNKLPTELHSDKGNQMS